MRLFLIAAGVVHHSELKARNGVAGAGAAGEGIRHDGNPEEAQQPNVPKSAPPSSALPPFLFRVSSNVFATGQPHRTGECQKALSCWWASSSYLSAAIIVVEYETDFLE